LLKYDEPLSKCSFKFHLRHYTAVSKLKTGRVLHHFPSALPGGSRNTRHGGDAFCILDCVFQVEDQVYYAMDCLAWSGVSFYDCPAEMRLSWLGRGALYDAVHVLGS